ncbi:disease resistance protein, partial [Trifolium medium]|nr:disease resistance protein [Trifolium medium]
MCDFYAEIYQKLHESGGTKFSFPSAEGEMIPEWFNHQSRGTTESGTTFPLWFRKKMPSIMIFVSVKSKTAFQWFLEVESPFVMSMSSMRIYDDIPPSHTCLFDMQLKEHITFHRQYYWPKVILLEEAFLKNEWIHAEIKFESGTAKFHLYFEEENNGDDIRFTNPYGKIKLDELEHIYQELEEELQAKIVRL